MAIAASAQDTTGLPSQGQLPATNSTGNLQVEVAAERTLKGHTFLFPAFVDSPFVATYVGLTLRANAFGAPAVPTDFGPSDLKMTGIRETLDLSFKASDWLAIQATVGGRALI